MSTVEELTPTSKTGDDSTTKDSSISIIMPGGREVRPWLVLISIIFGFFMSLLDATITNIALANIQNNFKTNLTTASWVIDAYSLVFAALLVTMGRLADQFGRKRLFMGGMILFSVGSLLCAMSPSVEFLIAFRAIQAIGASALEAVSLAIILVVFPKDKRAAAIGIWGALAGLAAAVGPIFGGFLLDLGRGNLEWRWIFFINLPICVLGLIMTARNVPEIKEANATSHIDFGGVLMLAAGIFCLTLGLIELNEWGWSSPSELALFAGAAVSLVIFYVVETRQEHPILDFSLFKIRSFTASCIVSIMFSIGFTGATLILTQYFVIARGSNPLEAAYSIIGLPLGIFAVSASVSQIASKLSPRILLVIGMLVEGLGLLSLCTLGLDASYIDTFWREALVGAGVGLCFNSAPSIALSEVPRAKLGVGSGAYNTFTQLGFVLGVAIMISALSGQFQTNLTNAKNEAVSVVKASSDIPPQAKDMIISGLQNSQPNSGAGVTNQNQLGGFGDNPLGKQINLIFKRALLDTFIFVWFTASMFGLFGVIPALFVGSGKKESTAEDLIVA